MSANGRINVEVEISKDTSNACSHSNCGRAIVLVLMMFAVITAHLVFDRRRNWMQCQTRLNFRF